MKACAISPRNNLLRPNLFFPSILLSVVDYSLNNRKYVLGFSVAAILIIYLVRLFSLQLMSDDYKMRADSNAFMRRILFPARGAITDRNGKLLVYNQM